MRGRKRRFRITAFVSVLRSPARAGLPCHVDAVQNRAFSPYFPTLASRRLGVHFRLLRLRADSCAPGALVTTGFSSASERVIQLRSVLWLRKAG